MKTLKDQILEGNESLSQLLKYPKPLRFLFKLLIAGDLLLVILLFVPASLLLLITYVFSGFNRNFTMKGATVFSYFFWGLCILLTYLTLEVNVKVEDQIVTQREFISSIELHKDEDEKFKESYLNGGPKEKITKRNRKKSSRTKNQGIGQNLKSDDLSNPKDSNLTLVIPNHTCAFDFVSHTIIAFFIGDFKNIKYFVKDSGKFVPFIGQALWLLQCCFLSRNKEKDCEEIVKYVKQLQSNNFRARNIKSSSTDTLLESRQGSEENQSTVSETAEFVKDDSSWLVLYPEGSRITKKKLEESQEFCKSRKITPYEHVLTPRATGFDLVRKNATFKQVMDITSLFCYQDDHNKEKLNFKTPTILNLIFGFPKRKLFINLKIRDSDDLQSSTILEEIFRRKDKILMKWREG